MILEENEEEEVRKLSIHFFQCVQNNNLCEIIKIFRNESIKPWEFLLEDGFSGLHKAVFLEYYLLICTMIDEMKIRLGVDAEKEIQKFVNKKTNKEGNSALHFASYLGNIDIIKILIENKAEVLICNFSGNNVLHMAAKGNNANSFIYFKEKFNINIESTDDINSTPLHRACFFGSDLVTNFILSFNVNINHKDKEGFTPLHLAVIAGKIKIIKEIIKIFFR